MTIDFKKLEEEIKRAEAWRLSLSEKKAMRDALVLRMQETSMPQSIFIPSPYSFFIIRRNAFVAFILIVALVGSGTAVAASENAIPGDTLYAVKTRFAEPAERALAFTAEQKAMVEIRQAKERLQEVTLLAASGERKRLQTAADAAVEDIMLARERVRLLENADADAALSDTFSAHADILDAQIKGSDDAAALSVAALTLIAREGEQALVRSTEQANDVVQRAREKIAKEDIREDAREALTAELSRVEIELTDAIQNGSLRGIALAGKRAYRVLAVAEAAKRIEEKTKKDVFIRFYEMPQPQPVISARAKEETDIAATTLFTTLLPEAPENGDAVSVDHIPDEDSELEFQVIDSRIDDDDHPEDESSDADDREDEENDTSGKSGPDEEEDTEEDHSGSR